MKSNQQLWQSFIILVIGVFSSGLIRMSNILWSNIIFAVFFVLFAVTLMLAFIRKEKPQDKSNKE